MHRFQQKNNRHTCKLSKQKGWKTHRISTSQTNCFLSWFGIATRGSALFILVLDSCFLCIGLHCTWCIDSNFVLFVCDSKNWTNLTAKGAHLKRRHWQGQCSCPYVWQYTQLNSASLRGIRTDFVMWHLCCNKAYIEEVICPKIQLNSPHWATRF